MASLLRILFGWLRMFPLGFLLVALIGMGIIAAGPIMLTWAFTVDCKGDKTCETNKENTKWAGLAMTLVFYLLSAFGLWSVN